MSPTLIDAHLWANPTAEDHPSSDQEKRCSRVLGLVVFFERGPGLSTDCLLIARSLAHLASTIARRMGWQRLRLILCVDRLSNFSRAPWIEFVCAAMTTDTVSSYPFPDLELELCASSPSPLTHYMLFAVQLYPPTYYVSMLQI